jgi:hypothetical protein
MNTNSIEWTGGGAPAQMHVRASATVTESTIAYNITVVEDLYEVSTQEGCELMPKAGQIDVAWQYIRYIRIIFRNKNLTTILFINDFFSFQTKR